MTGAKNPILKLEWEERRATYTSGFSNPDSVSLRAVFVYRTDDNYSEIRYYGENTHPKFDLMGLSKAAYMYAGMTYGLDFNTTGYVLHSTSYLHDLERRVKTLKAIEAYRQKLIESDGSEANIGHTCLRLAKCVGAKEMMLPTWDYQRNAIDVASYATWPLASGMEQVNNLIRSWLLAHSP